MSFWKRQKSALFSTVSDKINADFQLRKFSFSVLFKDFQVENMFSWSAESQP